MTMIQITEDKKEKMSEMCEKMLHYGGKIMQCLESLDEEDYGKRDDEDYDEYGRRSRYGMRRSRGYSRY